MTANYTITAMLIADADILKTTDLFTLVQIYFWIMHSFWGDKLMQL